MAEDITYREQLRSVVRAARYQPRLVAGTVILSVVAALLEGFGLSFILPIIELAQGEVDPEEATGLLGLFVELYRILGLPFTLGWLVLGISMVMTIRYTTSFLVGWLRATIEANYVRYLQRQAFEHAMGAEVAYFDEEGSDDILNAIVTQAEYAGRVLRYLIQVLEKIMLGLMYLTIAFVLAPILTIFTLVGFGVLTLFFRYVLEEAYSVGDHVADANERIQEFAQAGTQGIREVKLFGLTGELIDRFYRSVDQFTDERVRYLRNREAIGNYYSLTTAIMVFVLIWAGLTFSAMSLGELGIFLFAMFSLGPTVSKLNKRVYSMEGELPHLVRTQAFIDELRRHAEESSGTHTVPDTIETVTFEEVSFGYGGENEIVLEDVSFVVDRGEFVAFVGRSGSGKSTIASLVARLYEPDDGSIRADGIPTDAFDITEWRSSVAVVRQHPHIFNTTLRENVTVGKRDASQEELQEVCAVAQVTEFVDDLPHGYDTVLGDDGVRLSGGQRQRVAIARALLKDSDVLILDEATSDLDTHLEERVYRAIQRFDREYAALVIAHRLSTVAKADRIYVVEHGRIIEEGTHETLVNNGGNYAEYHSR